MRKGILFTLVMFFIVLTTSAQEQTRRDFQISFLSPLGTNGVESTNTINKISVNIVGGCSLGNTIFEFGGIYNVNLNFTKGFQLAGIINYTGNSINAAQMAGVINVAKQGSSPFQLAGIANITEEVNGLQFAGIINIARKVNGLQFGLINIAEECEGLSVGLINIVKKNGKREFEISFSECLNTAISFKLGTNKFYTIFSGGIKYIDQPVEFAAGIGFGTHVDWKKDWSNQIELLGYSITQDKSFDHGGNNMLTQLRLPVSKEFSNHFKIFAGPVLNIAISDLEDQNDSACSLSSWSLWKSTSGDTHVKGWIGFMAGIRF